jgi:hypothetical protein
VGSNWAQLAAEMFERTLHIITLSLKALQLSQLNLCVMR